MRSRPLPPLHSLVVFEAAARHLSFTQAADELNVTQGAVSRQIRQLEDYLGVVLFHRANRSISLSASGMRYYQSINSALHEIAHATADIRQWQGERKITVATTQAMAALWLLPRVTDFQRQHESVDLRIVAMDQVLNWKQLDCDIGLFYCRNPPAELHATRLFPERVFPVCSPSFFSRISHLPPEEILAARRLCLDESQQDWIGWDEWFVLTGTRPIKAAQETHINNYPLLLQAAINGQGLALAWDSLVDEQLKSGTLIKVTDIILKTDASFCMLEPIRTNTTTKATEDFKKWLIGQIEPKSLLKAQEQAFED